MMRFALISIAAVPVVLVGCQSPQPYGSSGPSEYWNIVDINDEDYNEVAVSAKKQRNWGWASHFVTTSSDDGIRAFIAGPFAYAGEDPSSISVNVWLFAEPPVTGRVRISATPEPGAALQSNWEQPLEFQVTMTKGWHSEDLILPQFQGPTASANIQWITDGPTDSSLLEIPPEED